jgi:hypothetical protein
MRELGIVLGLLLLLSTLALALQAPLLDAITLGTWIGLFGAAFGVPAGLAYHLALHRALAPRGALPKGWLMRPLELHDRLAPNERPLVLALCYAGAAGFLVICVGTAIVGCALFIAFTRGELALSGLAFGI